MCIWLSHLTICFNHWNQGRHSQLCLIDKLTVLMYQLNDIFHSLRVKHAFDNSHLTAWTDPEFANGGVVLSHGLELQNMRLTKAGASLWFPGVWFPRKCLKLVCNEAREREKHLTDAHIKGRLVAGLSLISRIRPWSLVNWFDLTDRSDLSCQARYTLPVPTGREHG